LIVVESDGYTVFKLPNPFGGIQMIARLSRAAVIIGIVDAALNYFGIFSSPRQPLG
jgi:hypothetical protein